MTDKKTRLAAISALLLTGILAGTQLGKIAPLVDWYRGEVGFSLVLIGWLTSMIGIFVALVALPAGWAIERAGMRRSFIASAAVMTVGGLALAFLSDPAAILAARLVEGLGYLVLVIVIPALLNFISLPSWRAPVLAIWGGFVPVGFAVADFMARGLLAVAEPKIFLLAAILAFAGFALAGAALLALIADADAGAGARPPRKPAALPRRSVCRSRWWRWRSASTSCCRSAFSPSCRPLSLHSGRQHRAVGGGDRAARADRQRADQRTGQGPRRPLRGPACRGGFRRHHSCGRAGLRRFRDDATTVAAVLIAISGGMTASALFASIPSIVPRGSSASVAIGLVCQAGGIGTVVGPPLAGHVIEAYGWPGSAISWPRTPWRGRFACCRWCVRVCWRPSGPAVLMAKDLSGRREGPTSGRRLLVTNAAAWSPHGRARPAVPAPGNARSACPASSEPLDHLPLFGDLAGKLFNGLFVFGRADFERRWPVVGRCHVEILVAEPKVDAGKFATELRQTVDIVPGFALEIDKRPAICRE